jgi:adenosylmethionine-8-amino-7-oxononanoate aminotransferase
VGEIRQCGFIVGIDIMHDPKGAIPFPWEQLTGARICSAARKHNLLTRPVRDTLVLMPPFCITLQQLDQAVEALRKAILEVCGMEI